ncbi:MAG: prephenate dehydratase [Raoultibacter sp.]
MTESPSIAYLGPIGTYTHEAALAFAERLGLDNPTLVEFASFDEIFDAVDRGKSTYGVVATENSLEGPVTMTLDNFGFKSTANIHCLLLHPEATLEDVTTIVSHPQGLAQCRRFIAERLPSRTTITTSSTAESAKLAASDKHVAGIANAFAAKLYNAKVYEEGIEDHFGNQTSFALIARQGAAPVFTGEKIKTSLALFLQADKTGALLMILSEFAYAGINLTKIQSRPTKQALGDYMFHVDIEGSINDLEVQTALNCLRLKLREVKILGSYPTNR